MARACDVVDRPSIAYEVPAGSASAAAGSVEPD